MGLLTASQAAGGSIGVGLFVRFTRTSDLKCGPGLQGNHTVVAVVPVQHLLGGEPWRARSPKEPRLDTPCSAK